MESKDKSTQIIAPIFISGIGKNQYINLSDEKLFEKIANKEMDEISANRAFHEIVSRYGGYVWKVCLINLKSDRDAAIEIARETLYKVFIIAHTFKTGTSVKGWLGRIAVNACIDCFNKPSTNPSPMDNKSLTEGRPFVESTGYSRLPLQAKAFQNAWMSLDEHKREVLKAYLRHYEVNDMGDHKHLPEFEIEFLCKSFGNIIKDKYYIPKIRDRAWEELQKKCHINLPFKK